MFVVLVLAYSTFGVALFQSSSYTFRDYGAAVGTVAAFISGSIDYSQFQDLMPFWGGAYLILITTSVTGLLLAYVSKKLVNNLPLL